MKRVETYVDSEHISTRFCYKTPIEIGVSFNAKPNEGTYTVTASVPDGGGLTGSDSITVVMELGSGGEITLTVAAYKIKTNKYADLSWSGATSANVDVCRNGSFVVTTPNDGAYTDKPSKTLTSATHKVCEAGTSTCSNQVTVTS